MYGPELRSDQHLLKHKRIYTTGVHIVFVKKLIIQVYSIVQCTMASSEMFSMSISCSEIKNCVCNMKWFDDHDLLHVTSNDFLTHGLEVSF